MCVLVDVLIEKGKGERERERERGERESVWVWKRKRAIVCFVCADGERVSRVWY